MGVTGYWALLRGTPGKVLRFLDSCCLKGYRVSERGARVREARVLHPHLKGTEMMPVNNNPSNTMVVGCWIQGSCTLSVYALSL